MKLIHLHLVMRRSFESQTVHLLCPVSSSIYLSILSFLSSVYPPTIDLFFFLKKNYQFPHLEELYRTGPKEAFFVVKVWADLNFDSSKIQQIAHEDDNGIIDPKPEEAVFNLAAQFESLENIPIECTTSAVSLGNIAAEKIQTQAARFEGGRFVYDMTSGTMCEYMTQFISVCRKFLKIQISSYLAEIFLQVFIAVATCLSVANIQLVHFFSIYEV